MNNKQQLFCDEYLIDLNGTQAAIRAGYSKKTANEQAARLLANVSIQEYIAQRMKERENRTGITQDRVLEEYAKIAFADPLKLFDQNGNIIPINLLNADIAASLISVNEKKSIDGIISREIKMADKLSALNSLARHLGMFTDQSEVNSRELQNMSGSELNQMIIEEMETLGFKVEKITAY